MAIPSVVAFIVLSPLFNPSAAAGGSKITVCHTTGSGGTNLISVSTSAWPAHQAHGDVLPSTWYQDLDGDGAGNPTVTSSACSAPSGYVSVATDCDDTNSAVNPGATEFCEAAGVDENCDGQVNDASAEGQSDWYLDADSDGFGDPGDYETACTQPAGTVADDTDCDDGDPDVNPNALETCSPVDDDCDGVINEGDAVDAGTWFNDEDGDTYGDPAVSDDACEVPLGFVADATDCDDGDAAVSPGADEVCNGLDDDCDDEADEAEAVDATVWFSDGDDDGYGDANVSEPACAQPLDYVDVAGDCDDSDGAVSPDADETCNTIDDNCDGVTDEPTAVDAPTWYNDSDTDSYGDPDDSAVACEIDGWVDNGLDCDDTTAAVNPDGTEVCDDGIDQDCTGEADEGCTLPDADGDGYTVADGDCDDSDLAVNPDATEACDGIDNDCSGAVDDGGEDVGFASSSDGADFSHDGPTTTANAYGIRTVGGLDFNGDGIDDFAVGGYGGVASIDIWYGAEGGITATPDLTLAADSTIRFFGQSINGGDVNGDGYDDLVVGAADQGHAVGGAERLFLGSASGLTEEYDWQVRSTDYSEEFGYSSAVADVNGDGYGDVLVVSRSHLCVYLGSATLPSTTGTCTSHWASLFSVGDFNNDTFDDLAYFEAVYPSTYIGTQIRYGSATGLGSASLLLAGLVAPGDGNQGRTQDYNGDGYDDLMTATGGSFALYPGGGTGLTSTSAWSASGTWGMAHAGDLNGDGDPDFAYSSGASVYIVLNTGSGLSTTPEPMVFTGTGLSKTLGRAGDVNGDGYDDLIASEYGYNGEQGHFYLFHGGSTGVCAIDDDLDGYVDEASGGDDCDDSDPEVNPDAVEECDGIDSDCDGLGDYTEEVDVCGSEAGVVGATNTASGQTSHVEADIHTLPDMDGDGGQEIADGAYIFSVPNGTGAAASGALATFSRQHDAAEVRAVGDIDADGQSDVAWQPSFNAPLAIMSGPVIPRAAEYGWGDTTSTISGSFNYFVSIDGGGDLTGDSYDDLVIGDWGGVYVLPGPIADGAVPLPAPLIVADGTYGKLLAGPMDLDGDGQNDLVASVGFCGGGGCGSNGGADIAVVWGGELTMDGSRSLTQIVADTDGRILYSNSGYSSHYTKVRSAGDATGDGIDDLIVMDRTHATVTILSTGSTRNGTIGTQTVTGFVHATDIQVAEPIDLDGDETMDLVIGSMDEYVNGIVLGAVWALPAIPEGATVDLYLDEPEAFKVVGPSEWGRFGMSLGVGDFDGDGFDDIAANDYVGNLYLLFPSAQ